MEQQTAQTIVKVVSILSYVFAALGLLFGVLMAIGASMVATMMGGGMMEELIAEDPELQRQLAENPEAAEAALAELDTLAPMIMTFGIIFGVFLIIMAVLDIFIGVGLWKFRNWARVLLLVVVSLSLLMAIVSLVIDHTAFGIVIFVFTAALCGLLIWLFAFQPDIVGLFRNAPVAQSTGQPAPAVKK